jgi:hypothetical protein
MEKVKVETMPGVQGSPRRYGGEFRAVTFKTKLKRGQEKRIQKFLDDTTRQMEFRNDHVLRFYRTYFPATAFLIACAWVSDIRMYYGTDHYRQSANYDLITRTILRRLEYPNWQQKSFWQRIWGRIRKGMK